ncbi:MAG: hypothetical protein LDLANPLL_00516 [Turneriella sp.]|nr:hypothetical protein [Turneriella sp.]
MKVTSKFLTGDVRVTTIEPVGDKIRISGLIKETFPIEIELTSADFADIFPLMLKPTPLVSVAKLSLEGIFASLKK